MFPLGAGTHMSATATPVVMRRNIIGLVRACHFQPTLAVTAMTTLLAITAGRGRGSFAVCAAVLAGQCSTGWSNDWRDAPRDMRAGRTDKPVVAGLISRRTVGCASAIALVAAIALSLLSGWRATLVHGVALGSAWAYNFALKTTVLSPVPYAVSFGLLPAFVTLGLAPPVWPSASLLVAGATLGVGAHFINTLSDRSDDELTGVRGLPQRCQPQVCLALGVGLLTVGACFAFVASTSGSLQWVLLCGALSANGAVVFLTRGGHPRAGWSATLVGVGCTVILFISAGASLRG